MAPKISNFYVPWADKCEWNAVKEQMLSKNIQDTIRAYETILMWKLRCSGIPAYIESTYSLLQVMVKEYEMNKNEEPIPLYSEHDLRLLYSTALIRFVNHVSSLSLYKGESLYLAAKTQNIPDWIINMRHDAAHGQGLPTLDALYMAAELSLKWLLDNYWSNPDNFADKVVDTPQPDFDSTQTLEAELNAKTFFKKAFTVWELCSIVKNEYLKELKREFFLHVEEMIDLYNLYYGHIESEDFVKFSSVVKSYDDCEGNEEINPHSSMKIKSFKKLIIKVLKSLIQSDDHIKHFLIISLFESTIILEISNPQKWQPIIHLLQEVNLFSQFLQSLFELAGKEHRGASEWLKTLLPSIKALKKNWMLFCKPPKELKNHQKKDLKMQIRNNFPKDLVIHLAIIKPPTITLEMMESVLLNPESLGCEVIKQYLELLSPPLLDSTFSLIQNLIKVQTSEKETGKENEEVDKIFTVEDLQKLQINKEDIVKEKANGSSGWVKSSIDIHTWSKSPLGLLPNQVKVDCGLDTGLTWKRKSLCRKRSSIPLLKHSIDMKRRETFNFNIENVNYMN